MATTEDIATLQQLLNKKLKRVPDRLRPPVTAQDIVNGAVPSKYPFGE
jgi:hypothetical protein